MPKDTRWNVASRNAGLDAMLALLDGGTLRLYDGTRPAGPATAITTQVLLSEHALNADAFAAAASGQAAANAIADDASANATGTATWGRFLSSGGTAICDVSVGTSDANIILNSVNIQAGALVSISGYTMVMPATSSA